MDTANHRCPRCGGPFHCGAADATPCACTTLSVAPALLAELARRYDGCLCLPCLAALAGAARDDRPIGQRHVDP
jgi:Cysteine-rich CWC